jgi:hypothetical protein
MQPLILVSILLIVLIYLHVTQNGLIFQPGVKAATTLGLTVLVMHAVSIYISPFLVMMITSGARNHRREATNANASLILGLLFALAIWTLVILAYAKFFAGCRKLAFFKKGDSVDPLLRAKVRSILLNVTKEKGPTDEYRMFIQVNHEDPLVEAIRSECEKTEFSFYSFSDDVLEKLTSLADKLKD